MPCSVSGRHTLICLQLLSTFVNKIFLKCMKHFHLPLITNTLAPQSHPPLIPFLLILTSQDARSFDPEPHRTPGLPQYLHPPRPTLIYNASASGSTTYSATPPSTLICFVSRKQFKIIPRSLLHLMDLSLLLSEPMAGSAPYLIASNLPPTMDPF